MQEVTLRTGVWYDDRTFVLTFPRAWDVRTYLPATPAPLSESQIAEALSNPIGQAPLAELARGKVRPVIVTDDLSRPTPVNKIMPLVLDQFRAAGVDLKKVRILVAAGTHGRQNPEALRTKLGEACFESCRVIVHRDKKNPKLIGHTSFGTPVYVDRELVDSDLIVGISGIYPQYTTGFGGGSKLALGVLGRKSISHLHFNSGDNDGSYGIDNDFRRNVTEMCRMIGLDSIFSVHSNADLQVVKLTCGDHYAYYPEAARFSLEAYSAPEPGDADVVIANGYPSDISYTFMRKGNRPILMADRSAFKIMTGSNPEGLGHHGLFPQGKSDRYLEIKSIYDRIQIMEPKVIARKVLKNLPLIGKSRAAPATATVPVSISTTTTGEADPIISSKPMWVYNPGAVSKSMPPIKEVRFFNRWEEILDLIKADLGDRPGVKVRIYSCAPLQCIETGNPVEDETRPE